MCIRLAPVAGRSPESTPAGRCASVPGRRARTPARSATAEAGRSRRSPTPSSCLGGSAPRNSSRKIVTSISTPRTSGTTLRKRSPIPSIGRSRRPPRTSSTSRTRAYSALRVVSVERGLDPREFALVAFGGAGLLHAPELAADLDIPRVVIPRTAGVLSALGLLTSDVLYDYSTSRVRLLDSVDVDSLEGTFAGFEAEGRDRLAEEGFSNREAAFERTLDLRYAGQAFELSVSVPKGPIDRGEYCDGRRAVPRGPPTAVRPRLRGRIDRTGHHPAAGARRGQCAVPRNRGPESVDRRCRPGDPRGDLRRRDPRGADLRRDPAPGRGELPWPGGYRGRTEHDRAAAEPTDNSRRVRHAAYRGVPR